MNPCEGCGRHVRVAGACPFCGASAVAGGLARVAAAGATLVVLAACYGPPPGSKDDFNECVADSDELQAELSCEDGIDNDCDELMDGADPDCEAASSRVAPPPPVSP